MGAAARTGVRGVTSSWIAGSPAPSSSCGLTAGSGEAAGSAGAEGAAAWLGKFGLVPVSSASTRRLFEQKTITASEAAERVSDGQIVYIGTCSSVAYGIARAIADRIKAGGLTNIGVGCSNIFKDIELMKDPEHCHVASSFMGPGERDAQKHGNYDFTSIHLSQIDIFYHKTFPTDIAFLEVSFPDNDYSDRYSDRKSVV